MERPVRQRETKKDSTQAEKQDEQTCDECGSTALIMSGDQGEIVCEECGLVVDEKNIDHGPEWRAFNATERNEKSRVGAPTTQTMHDKGLTTTIDWKNKDAYGRSLSSDKRQRMGRLRKWQERIRTKDAGERNLQFALTETDRMASALGVPQSVREVASVIYRRALAEDLIRGRSIEGVATSSLYAPMEILLTDQTTLAKIILRATRTCCRVLASNRQPANRWLLYQPSGGRLHVSESRHSRHHQPANERRPGGAQALTPGGSYTSSRSSM